MNDRLEIYGPADVLGPIILGGRRCGVDVDLLGNGKQCSEGLRGGREAVVDDHYISSESQPPVTESLRDSRDSRYLPGNEWILLGAGGAVILTSTQRLDQGVEQVGSKGRDDSRITKMDLIA